MAQLEEVELGKAVFSNTVCVSDPCYPLGTWCGEYDVTVKPGQYTSKVVKGEFRSWGNRNWRLTAQRDGEEPVTWEFYSSLGVDSGTMSIIDGSSYESENESFQDAWEEVNNGFSVSSGIGDGVYGLYLGRNEEDEAVALSVVFLDYIEPEEGEEIGFEDKRCIRYASCKLEDFTEHSIRARARGN